MHNLTVMRARTYLVVAALFLCALPAHAAITVTFTFSPQFESGSDFFGLDGSTFTFTMDVTEQNYRSDVVGTAQVNVPASRVSLTVSGSTSADGSYDISTTAPAVVLAPNIGDAIAAFFDTNFDNFLYEADNLFSLTTFDPSGSNIADPQPGDPIAVSDFNGLMLSDSFVVIPESMPDDFGTYAFTNGQVTAVPELSTYSVLTGLAALMLVVLRPRR